ncbi:Nitroreductase [hydrothermal vent metagenome]|uniref:Nitroreductase n=1 Tax=hydrothermal vent metagenome TaxID=652676 RepID=A0A3B1DHQ8_9ZZZZ
MNIIDAITSRYSARQFLEKTVDKKVIEAILDAARWSPSGANTQPWQVVVISGETKQILGNAITTAREEGQKPNPDYAYYSGDWKEPYLTRRKKCGMALYGALNIQKREVEKRKVAWDRNYHFFGAPVGFMFLIDDHLGTGSIMDYGMFLQSIMLAAQEYGLATCPQAAMAEYPDIVRETLHLPAEKQILCGMALGYPNKEHPVNQYRTERVPVEKFTQWVE